MIKKIISTGYCVNDVTYQAEITFELDINVFYNKIVMQQDFFEVIFGVLKFLLNKA